MEQNQLNNMEYSYFVLKFNGRNTLYRMEKGLRIYEGTHTLEVLFNNKWCKEENPIKTFMNNYITGWVDKDDAMDYETAMERLKNEGN